MRNVIKKEHYRGLLRNPERPAQVFLVAYALIALYLIGPVVLMESMLKIFGGVTSAERASEDAQFAASGADEARLKTYLRDCKRCEHRDKAESVIQGLVRDRENRRRESERRDQDRKRDSEQRDQERVQYSVARGDLDLLSAYVRLCRICDEKRAANDEIAAIKSSLAAKERDIYMSARGDPERLRRYARDCKVCEYLAAANAEAGGPNKTRPTVTWRVNNGFGRSVGVAFFSKSIRWPTGNGWHPLDTPGEREYVLACVVGETICYGARSADNGASAYWGWSAESRVGCSECCFLCDGASHRVDLTAQNARNGW